MVGWAGLVMILCVEDPLLFNVGRMMRVGCLVIVRFIMVGTGMVGLRMVGLRMVDLRSICMM